MSIWKTDELGKFVTLKRGYDLPQQKRVDGAVPIFSSSGVTGTHKESMVNAPGVITGRYGTIGEVFFSKEPFWPLNTTLYVENFHGNDERFIYYFLKSLKWEKFTSASAVPGINRNTVHKEIVEIPDLESQRKIAAVLSAFDDKIDINQRINDNLEEQSKVIFDKLFPNISNGSYTVGNYITPKRGKNLLSKNAVQGNVPVVAGGLVPSVYHNTSNTKAPVLAISASGANAGYVSLWNIPIWASDSSYIDSSMTNNVYFWYVLLKKRQKEIFDAQTGSAQPHIYPQHIAGMPIKELEVAKIQEFNAMVTPIFEKIGKNLKENTQLETLRDILLPKLMSGEIDISAVQF